MGDLVKLLLVGGGLYWLLTRMPAGSGSGTSSPAGTGWPTSSPGHPSPPATPSSGSALVSAVGSFFSALVGGIARALGSSGGGFGVPSSVPSLPGAGTGGAPDVGGGEVLGPWQLQGPWEPTMPDLGVVDPGLAPDLTMPDIGFEIPTVDVPTIDIPSIDWFDPDFTF